MNGGLINRALTLALLIGMLCFFGSSLVPLDQGKRQAILFGLCASVAIRLFYIMVREGWDAANEWSDRDSGVMWTTLLVGAAIFYLF